MDMKFVRPLAIMAAAVLPTELVLAELAEHHKQQQHMESIRVVSPGQVSNAANVAMSTPVMVSNVDVTGGLVLPESGRYLITIG